FSADIIITGFMVNAHGADVPQKGDTRDYTDKPYGGVLTLEGGYEYIQFMALRDIDFSQTPYSVVVGRHYTPHPEGWATGGSRSFKFNLTEGQAAQGTFFYVGTGAKRIDGYWDEGHSTDISAANWIRNIQANLGDDNKVAGDGFGSSTSGLLTNSKKADGIAVFEGTDVTASSVPIDAVFYGSEVDGALDGGEGYLIPEQSDLYSAVNKETGEKQPFFGQGTNTYMYPSAGDGNFRQLGGIFTENGVIEPRGTADTYG